MSKTFRSKSIRDSEQITAIQRGCMTRLTLEGERDYTNKKPFRTKHQKELARAKAWKGKDGAWHSNVPVQYHSKPYHD